jgi:parvulin-like peptidyl-prolyl isomerase
MRIRAIVPALVLLAAFAAHPLFAAGDDLVLARVGGEPVTASQIEAEFTSRHAGHAKFMGGPAEIREFLDKVIDQRLLVQEAYRLELDQVPAVRTRVDAYAENRAVQELIEREIKAKAKPTEAAIRAAWETHTTTLYQVLQIVVPSREEAEEVALLLAGGGEFTDLARERSTARTRLRGGMIPSVGWGTMSPEWERLVFALEDGQTSAPFESADGWEIVRLVGRRTVDKPGFEKARGRIATILEQRALAERRAAFSEELWTKYGARLSVGVEFAPAPLSALAKSAPGTVLATWRGGALDLATFATGLDLDSLAAQPERAGRAEIDRLVRLTVNDALARLEVSARDLTSVPEVARDTRRYEESLIEQVLYADHVLKGVEIGEAEIRAGYDAHPEELQAPERRRTSQIVVGTRAEAERLSARLVAGEEFAQLAREASLDVASAKDGGDLGWTPAGEIPSEFTEVLTLGVGETSGPIESKYGWHLMKVTGIEAAHPMSYEEGREKLRERLFERKKSEHRAEWVRQLRAATAIEIDETAIETLAAEKEDAGAAPPSHGMPASHGGPPSHP